MDNIPWKATCISDHLSLGEVSHSKLARRSGKIIAGLPKLREQPQSRTLYSMGFLGRAYIVDTGIMGFFSRKEFQGGKLVGTESSFVFCH